jgi:hypothetical protein
VPELETGFGRGSAAGLQGVPAEARNQGQPPLQPTTGTTAGGLTPAMLWPSLPPASRPTQILGGCHQGGADDEHAARPLIVLTADSGSDDDRWPVKQDHLITLSTNGLHRHADATHTSLVEDRVD